MPRVGKSETAVRELLKQYRAICAAIRKLDIPQGNQFLQIFEASLAQYDKMLAATPRRSPPSKIAVGLRQGLREMPLVLEGILAGVAPADRAAIQAALESSLPDRSEKFPEKEQERAREVMKRCAIRNDDEWYLLRWHLDAIEGRPAHQDDIKALNRLLDAYEVASHHPKK
jgi:hypothetical protein